LDVAVRIVPALRLGWKRQGKEMWTMSLCDQMGSRARAARRRRRVSGMKRQRMRGVRSKRNLCGRRKRVGGG
jgi:hypothetical protein